MYDAPRYGVKDCYEDAVMFFNRAREAAENAGVIAESQRLKDRCEQVREVYNNQFRGL